MKTKTITLSLEGSDGNAAALLGAFIKQAKREGWTPDEIKTVTAEATSGNYDHLLSVLMMHCEDASDNEGETK